jgi:hypothetical protein
MQQAVSTQPIPQARTYDVTPATLGRGLAERLERGEVPVFPAGMLPLPPADDLEFLRRELGNMLALKNISYHPHGDHLSGIKGNREYKERTRQILAEHNRVVTAFLEKALPEYAGGWRIEKVNFRPIQEKGRDLKPRASNERLHTDAFASGATHGGRILRFFTNIHPTAPRVWKSSGLFPELYREFGAAAGIARPRLTSGVGNRLLSGTLKGVSKVAPKAILADTTPYDRAMLKMHNFLKDSDAFQGDESRQVFMRFEPFQSWCVLTDTVSHAVTEGQHALVNTYYVALDRCVVPELAPFRVMEKGL